MSNEDATTKTTTRVKLPNKCWVKEVRHTSTRCLIPFAGRWKRGKLITVRKSAQCLLLGKVVTVMGEGMSGASGSWICSVSWSGCRLHNVFTFWKFAMLGSLSSRAGQLKQAGSQRQGFLPSRHSLPFREVRRALNYSGMLAVHMNTLLWDYVAEVGAISFSLVSSGKTLVMRWSVGRCLGWHRVGVVSWEEERKEPV